MIDAGLRVYGEFCPDTSGYFGDDKMVVEIFRAMNVARSSAVTQALDALGLALAQHAHIWTARERQLYEQAITTASGGCTEIGSSETDRRLPPMPSYRRHPRSGRV